MFSSLMNLFSRSDLRTPNLTFSIYICFNSSIFHSNLPIMYGLRISSYVLYRHKIIVIRYHLCWFVGESKYLSRFMLGVMVSLLFVVAWQFVSIISRFLNFSIRLVYVYSCPINSAQPTLPVPAIFHHHECFSLFVTFKCKRMFVNGAKSKAETYCSG